MLKFLFKLSLVAFILFALGVYANYLMTGKVPNVNIQSPTIPEINISEITDNLSEKIKLTKKEKGNSTDNVIYKWRDDNGVIYYTSERPPDGVNFETIAYNKETNVVPAINTESEDIPTQENRSKPSPNPPSTTLPENVYSPEGIEHLFNQAKDIQGLVNDQFSQQKQIINRE